MASGGIDSARRTRHRIRPQVPVESPWCARLTQLTDAGLLLTLAAVTLCFGGRTEIGQLVLVVLTSATSIAWCLRQLTAESSAWRSTGTIWMWSLGALLAVVQVMPLSQSWLHAVSPEHGRVLPAWSSAADGLFPVWTTLSLNPAETASGLATFLCYALVFLVATQRMAAVSDVERLLQGIVCVGVGVAGFAILQYLLSNGQFFWIYQHPTVTTSHHALGPFTNRNHLAQYLAMTIGPAIWWMIRAADAEPESHHGFGGSNTGRRPLVMALIAAGLATMLLAGLLSVSRAGAAAMAIAVITGLTLLGRRGHLPAGVLPIALLIGLVVGGGAVATNYETLANRIDQFQAGVRPVIWAANIRVASRFPWFGTGVGTHLAAHPLETDVLGGDSEFSHAESGYLQIASECGVIGLAIAGLMITACLRWCWIAMRPTSRRDISIAAAAISASLAANLLHAGVDFFWYAPACMLMVALLAACGCRLAQFAAASQGHAEPVAVRSRPLWGVAGLGLTALAAWMISVKLPGALAEPHRTAYLRLVFDGDQDDDEADPLELEREKMSALIAAARLDPSDSRAQLSVAAGYLRLFQLKQAAADNPMTLDQLRDAATASEFESAQALHDWLQAAVGPQVKYLQAAQHYSRKALKNCPLEGMGYVQLARLDFLRDPQADRTEGLQQQALAVRPFDAAVDFEIGRLASQQGDLDRAMLHWRKAFQRNADHRREIAQGLAGQLSADEFLERFAPDWQGLGVVLHAYEAANLDEELPQLRQRYAEACRAEAQRTPAARAEALWLEAVKTWQAAGETPKAIQAAREALESQSQSIELHKTLAGLWIEQQDYGRAAKHLKWAAARAPDDARLQRLAADTARQALRSDVQQVSGEGAIDR